MAPFSIPVLGPLSAVDYYIFKAVAFRYLSPPIGRITARASELESQLRNFHKRYALELALPLERIDRCTKNDIEHRFKLSSLFL